LNVSVTAVTFAATAGRFEGLFATQFGVQCGTSFDVDTFTTVSLTAGTEARMKGLTNLKLEGQLYAEIKSAGNFKVEAFDIILQPTGITGGGSTRIYGKDNLIDSDISLTLKGPSITLDSVGAPNVVSVDAGDFTVVATSDIFMRAPDIHFSTNGVPNTLRSNASETTLDSVIRHRVIAPDIDLVATSGIPGQISLKGKELVIDASGAPTALVRLKSSALMDIDAVTISQIASGVATFRGTADTNIGGPSAINVDIQGTGLLNLKAGGACSNQAGGAYSITAGATFSASSTGNCSVNGGAAVTINAVGAGTFSAGGAATFSAGAAAAITAGQAITISAGAACAITSVAALTISAGAALTITAVGLTTISGAALAVTFAGAEITTAGLALTTVGFAHTLAGPAIWTNLNPLPGASDFSFLTVGQFSVDAASRIILESAGIYLGSGGSNIDIFSGKALKLTANEGTEILGKRDGFFLFGENTSHVLALGSFGKTKIQRNLSSTTNEPLIELFENIDIFKPIRLMDSGGAPDSLFAVTKVSNQFLTPSSVGDTILKTDGNGQLLFSANVAATPALSINTSNQVSFSQPLALASLSISGDLQVSGTISAPTRITTDNSADNRKLVLFSSANNDHEYYGLGINFATIRYQAGSAAGAHKFYAATSSTASQELFVINGNGQVGTGDLSRLRVSANNTDYTLIGTNTVDNNTNTRIVLSGSNRGFGVSGNIEYITGASSAAHIFYTFGSPFATEKFRVTSSGATVTGDLTVTGTLIASITPTSPLTISTSNSPGSVLNIVRPSAGALTIAVSSSSSNFINQALANDTVIDTDGSGNIRFSAQANNNQSLLISTTGAVSLCSTLGDPIFTTTDTSAALSAPLQINTTPTYPITSTSPASGLYLNQNGAGIIEANDPNFSIHFRKNRLGTVDDFTSHHAFAGHKFYGGSQILQNQTIFLQIGPLNTKNTGSFETTGTIYTTDLSRLKISANNTDYTLIGTNTVDNNTNTRIVLSGAARGPGASGNIEYITGEASASHIFYTFGSPFATEKFRVTTSGATVTGDLTVTGTVSFPGAQRLNNNPLYLRTSPDTNHYLAYNATRDGPGLYGFNGGSLGTTNSGVNEVAYWDAGAFIMRKDFYTLNSGQSFGYTAGSFSDVAVNADGGGLSFSNVSSHGKWTQVGSMVNVHFYVKFDVLKTAGGAAPYYVFLGPTFPYTLTVNSGANCVGVSMGGCVIGGIGGLQYSFIGHLLADGNTYSGRPGTGKRIYISVYNDWVLCPATIGVSFSNQILQGNFTMYI
jgi:hypothetical protein